MCASFFKFNSSPFLKREGDKLILHSKNDMKWLGLVIGVIVPWWAWGWYTHAASEYLRWFGLLIALPMIAFGGFLLLPRTITTIFDARERRAIVVVSIAWGWYQRSNTYSFADIVGVGFKDYRMLFRLVGGEAASHPWEMPVMKLQNGRIRWLATLPTNLWHWPRHARYAEYADDLAAVCTATGLEQLPL
jgi:hypothetical protein